MPAITVRKFRMNYEVAGKGFPLLLVHGLGGDSRNWIYQIPEFSKRYRVFAPDLRGHGQSEAPKSSYSLDAFTEDVVEFLKQMGISKCYYVGLSMGGMIGQNLAIQHPELIEGLALVDTSPSPGIANRPGLDGVVKMFEMSAKIAETQGRGPLVDATLKLMFTPEFVESSPEIMDKIRGYITNGPTEGYVGAIRNIFLTGLDLYPLLGEISAPTLIVCGSRDALTPLPESQRMNKAIKDSELKVIEDSGHVTIIQKHEEFNRILAAFLKKMDTRRYKPPAVSRTNF